jgi:hypothetical protein
MLPATGFGQVCMRRTIVSEADARPEERARHLLVRVAAPVQKPTTTPRTIDACSKQRTTPRVSGGEISPAGKGAMRVAIISHADELSAGSDKCGRLTHIERRQRAEPSDAESSYCPAEREDVGRACGSLESRADEKDGGEEDEGSMRRERRSEVRRAKCAKESEELKD